MRSYSDEQSKKRFQLWLLLFKNKKYTPIGIREGRACNVTQKIINVLPFDVQNRLRSGEKLNIIDVRENQEVQAGKIPSARHIRLSEIPDRMHEINPDAETILVCRSGNRSAKACEFLMNQGYRNVKSMMGGMNAWEGDTEV